MIKMMLKVRRNRFSDIADETRRRLREHVEDTGDRVLQRAKDHIENDPKTGHVYRRETDVSFTTKGGTNVAFTAHKGSTTEHQASAPGEAPATDMGDLVNESKSEMTGPLTNTVTFSSDHALPLEFGATNMEPRPYLGRSVEEEESSFVAGARRIVAGE